MVSDSGKVARRLSVRITPMRGGKIAFSVQDATTRSEESKRHTEAEITADVWDSPESAKEAFGMLLDRFIESLENEDEGELFADEKGPKPRLDAPA
jgi:predicted RNA-binding protein with RPS1 domain